MKGWKLGLVAMTAISGAVVAPASAMPVSGLQAANEVSADIENVAWCGYHRCWWGPRYHYRWWGGHHHRHFGYRHHRW
jgi:hypothetical protein